MHEGKTAYRGHGTDHWIHWNESGSSWLISTHPDEAPTSWWYKALDPVTGEYAPEGDYTGTATVAEA